MPLGILLKGAIPPIKPPILPPLKPHYPPPPIKPSILPVTVRFVTCMQRLQPLITGLYVCD
jgi:hypothetical protein